MLQHLGALFSPPPAMNRNDSTDVFLFVYLRNLSVSAFLAMPVSRPVGVSACVRVCVFDLAVGRRHPSGNVVSLCAGERVAVHCCAVMILGPIVIITQSFPPL